MTAAQQLKEIAEELIAWTKQEDKSINNQEERRRGGEEEGRMRRGGEEDERRRGEEHKECQLTGVDIRALPEEMLLEKRKQTRIQCDPLVALLTTARVESICEEMVKSADEFVNRLADDVAKNTRTSKVSVRPHRSMGGMYLDRKTDIHLQLCFLFFSSSPLPPSSHSYYSLIRFDTEIDWSLFWRRVTKSPYSSINPTSKSFNYCSDYTAQEEKRTFLRLCGVSCGATSLSLDLLVLKVCYFLFCFTSPPPSSALLTPPLLAPSSSPPPPLLPLLPSSYNSSTISINHAPAHPFQIYVILRIHHNPHLVIRSYF